MEINSFQHPDFVWTWKSSKRNGKASLWLPYFQKVERLPKGKSDRYCFQFNGGEVTCHLKEIDFLMLYGATGHLPVEFLDKLSTYKIPLMIHRRNMPRPYVFFPNINSDNKDILTAQILHRENNIRRTYIARILVKERIRSFENLITISNSDYTRLASARNIKKIRSIEARLTKRYWSRFYERIDCSETTRRDNSHPVNTALDAMSFFVYGVILRWALFHKLSPCHAYLHETTTYPSLCYDLIEPYRYLIENVLLKLTGESINANNIVSASITQLKEDLDEIVYVPSARLDVSRKNLLHGIILALRAYLLKESKRFIIPREGVKSGGRPLKPGYRLPGGR